MLILISCFLYCVYSITFYYYFCLQINELQKQEVIASKFAESRKAEKRSRYDASRIHLLCRNCFNPVVLGSNIKLLDNTHYVNISPDFKWVELLVA